MRDHGGKTSHYLVDNGATMFMGEIVSHYFLKSRNGGVPCKCLSINTCCSFWLRERHVWACSSMRWECSACRGMQEHVEH
jgi:hypothetical protein